VIAPSSAQVTSERHDISGDGPNCSQVTVITMNDISKLSTLFINEFIHTSDSESYIPCLEGSIQMLRNSN